MSWKPFSFKHMSSNLENKSQILCPGEQRQQSKKERCSLLAKIKFNKIATVAEQVAGIHVSSK